VHYNSYFRAKGFQDNSVIMMTMEV